MFKRLVKSRSFAFGLVALLLVSARHVYNKSQSFYVPEYKYEKLTENSEPDKAFSLAGLSPWAFEQMKQNGSFAGIDKLNKMYFKKPEINTRYILFPVTAEERLAQEKVPFAPVKTGDVLVTFGTHTLDWRHGHASLVLDGDTGTVLEHACVGSTSKIVNIKRWQKYPSFVILRHIDEQTAKKAAIYASDNLVDVAYSVFAGLIDKDKSDNREIDSSHCSHIIWQAFKAAGSDIDSNGGKIITPKDIAGSDKLRVVQIFGVNPEMFKSRILKGE